MDTNLLIEKLKSYNLFSEEAYRKEAFSRNIGLLTEQEQERLSKAKVAIPGMGGVGGVHFMTMVRTGVGKFNISDFDIYEPVNVNRQLGARIPDFGRSKMDVMKEQALSVNPFIEINEFPDGINDKNIDIFLEGVDVVLDSLDFFAFDVRRMLFTRAREKGVYVITAGPLGFGSAMLVFAPDKGMSFDEYFNIVKGMKPEEQYLAFAIGLAPRALQFKYMDTSKVNLKSRKGPSLNIGCQLCSAMAGTEAVRIILKRGGIKPVPYYFQFDPYMQKYCRGKLFMGNKNPLQRLKAHVVKYMLKKNEPNGKATFPSLPAVVIGESITEIPHEILQYIVDAGTWAPSADNCQPWIIKCENNTLLIFKDSRKSGFFYDINNESTFMTLGALTENICIAASHFGLEVDIETFPDGRNSDLVIKATLSFKRVGEDSIFPWLFSRCVNRNPFMDKPIDREIHNTVNSSLRNSFGFEIHWIKADEDKKIMQKIVFDADRILFEDKRLHQGLFKWINLYGHEQAEGMNMNSLEINMIQRIMFPFLADWNKLGVLNHLGASRMAALNSVKLLRSSPAYCLLTIKDKTPESYIHGGRMMERFWIKAASLGLSLQPMAGFVFLLNHLEHNGASKFNSRHKNIIVSMKEKIDEQLTLNLQNRSILMFFRAGYCGKSTPRTNRKKIVIS